MRSLDDFASISNLYKNKESMIGELHALNPINSLEYIEKISKSDAGELLEMYHGCKPVFDLLQKAQPYMHQRIITKSSVIADYLSVKQAMQKKASELLMDWYEQIPRHYPTFWYRCTFRKVKNTDTMYMEKEFYRKLYDILDSNKESGPVQYYFDSFRTLDSLLDTAASKLHEYSMHFQKKDYSVTKMSIKVYKQVSSKLHLQLCKLKALSMEYELASTLKNRFDIGRLANMLQGRRDDYKGSERVLEDLFLNGVTVDELRVLNTIETTVSDATEYFIAPIFLKQLSATNSALHVHLENKCLEKRQYAVALLSRELSDLDSSMVRSDSIAALQKRSTRCGDLEQKYALLEHTEGCKAARALKERYAGILGEIKTNQRRK